MINPLKMYRRELFLVLVSIATISAMVILNDIGVHIRLRELRMVLQQGNREESNLDHIGLIMKYHLHKRMYENSISDEEADTIENNINRIIARRAVQSGDTIQRYRYASVPVLSFINMLRFITGKRKIRHVEDEASSPHLDAAYYYERNKSYRRALTAYQQARREWRGARTVVASIIVHEGFCHSMLGDYRQAKDRYLTVVNEYSDVNVAMTAAVLLKYLDGFRTEYHRVMGRSLSPKIRSEKLYKLLAYREAIKTLDAIAKTDDRHLGTRLEYYKGKCYEELGEKERAVDSYLKVITESHRTKFAKLANRRVYVIGTQVKNGSEIKKMALQINTVLKDREMEVVIEESEKSRLKSVVAPEKKQVDLHQSRIKAVDRMLGDKKGDDTDYGGKTVKVFTSGGNVFVGSVVEYRQDVIWLMTSIGKVSVRRDEIRSLEVQR